MDDNAKRVKGLEIALLLVHSVPKLGSHTPNRSGGTDKSRWDKKNGALRDQKTTFFDTTGSPTKKVTEKFC